VSDVKCKYRDEEGWCHWKYEGFKCIKERCPYYMMLTKQICEYNKNGFCEKYGRFGCPGIEKCGEFPPERKKRGKRGK